MTDNVQNITRRDPRNEGALQIAEVVIAKLFEELGVLAHTLPFALAIGNKCPQIRSRSSSF
jgi:hypothetical protein